MQCRGFTECWTKKTLSNLSYISLQNSQCRGCTTKSLNAGIIYLTLCLILILLQAPSKYFGSCSTSRFKQEYPWGTWVMEKCNILLQYNKEAYNSSQPVVAAELCLIKLTWPQWLVFLLMKIRSFQNKNKRGLTFSCSTLDTLWFLVNANSLVNIRQPTNPGQPIKV